MHNSLLYENYLKTISSKFAERCQLQVIYNVDASNVTHFFTSYILHKPVVAFLRPISARLPVFTLIYSTGAALWPETCYCTIGLFII